MLYIAARNKGHCKLHKVICSRIYIDSYVHINIGMQFFTIHLYLEVIIDGFYITLCLNKILCSRIWSIVHTMHNTLFLRLIDNGLS